MGLVDEERMNRGVQVVGKEASFEISCHRTRGKLKVKKCLFIIKLVWDTAVKRRVIKVFFSNSLEWKVKFKIQEYFSP